MTSVFGSERSSLNEYEWRRLSWICFLHGLMTSQGSKAAVLLSNDLDQRNESRRNGRALLHNSFDHFKCKAAPAAECPALHQLLLSHDGWTERILLMIVCRYFSSPLHVTCLVISEMDGQPFLFCLLAVEIPWSPSLLSHHQHYVARKENEINVTQHKGTEKILSKLSRLAF